jgi:hypothetical protein
MAAGARRAAAAEDRVETGHAFVCSVGSAWRRLRAWLIVTGRGIVVGSSDAALLANPSQFHEPSCPHRM